MKITLRGFGIYLVVGFLYQLAFYQSINPFRLSFWGHVLFWLPLIVIHWFLSVLVTLIVVGLVLWFVSTYIFTDLGKFFSYLWKKATG